MSLQAIGRGIYQIRRVVGDVATALKDRYRNNEGFRTAVNTGTIYGGLNLAGNIAEHFTGLRGLDGATDIAAALISGGYLNRNVDRLTQNKILQNIIHLATAGAVVGDVGHEIQELPHYALGFELGDVVKDGYETLHRAVGRHIPDLMNKYFTTDAIAGATGGALAQIFEGYRAAARTRTDI